MAVAVHINPQQMSRADYERVMGELGASGGGEPDGRRMHAAYGSDQVQMFEVWDSEQQFDAHSDRLFGLMQDAGINPGIVEVHPLHSAPPS
jgi:hypothetical protein